MSKTTTRLATLALGVAAAGVTAGMFASGASAVAVTSTTLAPGQQTCVSQYAAYQVRADGNATKSGARFTVRRNGVAVFTSPNNINAFAAELRTSFGNFPGPGVYQVCAVNNLAPTNTNAYVTIRTDGEVA